MELASPLEKQWFLTTTFEYHDISDLVAGSSTVPDETGRDRQSSALAFEISRGISEKWSVSGLVSVVQHERNVGGVSASATGIGDAIAIVRYSPRKISLYSATSLSLGFGGRLPVGQDDATLNGIVLAEDMQPSTGASAGIVWFYAARALNESRNIRVYGTLSYTANGENDRDYRFGHEVSLTLGGTYQTQSPWAFGLELVHRRAKRDERAGARIPNTGGTWLDIVPAVQYHIRETLALKASAKLPVHRNLNDALQFTTKYALRLSLSHVFGAPN